MSDVITLQNVNKFYDKQTVLDQVSLTVKQGEIVGLIGPSGSGKTTLIKIALGMEISDSGTAEVFETKMPNRELLGQLGYMAQSDALYEQLTAKENLRFYAVMKGINKKEIPAEIERVTKVVDLSDDLSKFVAGYSGGMKRRLSLAISFLGNPPLMILDEPTVGIDPALRRQIWAELKARRDAGQTILITTHVMDEAELVDRVALLLGGKLIANDSPKALEEQYGVPTIEEVFLTAEGAI
ncbi:MAG: ABC transporter ATP-binding protein [Lactobacillaceae bacterium]|nr:ABC transporter ATP-binding protein [Lactobacillaceae bacterium]